MNSRFRNLTLSAAALAALMATAPKAAADDHGWGNGRGPFESPRQEFREHGWRGPYGHGFHGYGYGYGHGFVAPVRPYVRYRTGYAAPFRVFSGVRFYSACPGPGYVYVVNYGWVLPPFFGAVWTPGHYGFRGIWVDGFWR